MMSKSALPTRPNPPSLGPKLRYLKACNPTDLILQVPELTIEDMLRASVPLLILAPLLSMGCDRSSGESTSKKTKPNTSSTQTTSGTKPSSTATQSTSSTQSNSENSTGSSEPAPDPCKALDQAACEGKENCQTLTGQPLLTLDNAFCAGDSEFIGCIQVRDCEDAVFTFCTPAKKLYQTMNGCAPSSWVECEQPGDFEGIVPDCP